MSWLVPFPFRHTNFSIYSWGAMFVASATATVFLDKKVSRAFLNKIPEVVVFASSLIIGSGTGELVERLIRIRNPSDLSKILTKINNCEATNELYRKAQTVLKETYKVDLKIRMERGENVSFGAACNTSGEIVIDADQSEQQSLESLIFELANLSQFDRFKEICDLASVGKINREDYALRIELIELESVKIYTRTIKAAGQEKKVDWVTWDMYLWDHLMPEKFNLFFERLSGHTGFYYRQWDKLYGKDRDNANNPHNT